LPTHKDLEAREKWFYQAQIASPALFRRDAKAGSLYWLGTRDATDAFFDGRKTYKLTVPMPVPARLFWSVTIYDPLNRSEIQTDQGKAALRSLFELNPTAPPGPEGEWIKTIPGKGWFVYFRHLRPRDARLRRKLEAGGFRVGEMSAFPLRLNDASDWPSTRWDYLR